MEPPSKTSISILNETGRQLRTAAIRRGVEAALRLHGREGAIVSVLLSSDDEVQKLNSQYRGVNEPTDVLSFPFDGFPGAPLGDIAIAVPYAERQARERGVSLEQELGFLAIHGALHLAGLDDETNEDRRHMVAQMNVAAVEAGLKPDEAWYSLLHAQEDAI